MGKITGFLEYDRETPQTRPVKERLKDFNDVYTRMPLDAVRRQAARCMDCGVPFCHNACPLHNLCPEWNDLVYRGEMAMAAERLLSTNNFPEFTSRICPALCEASCVLGQVSASTTCQLMERTIIEYAFENGLIAPQPPAERSGRHIAVVGSGPAGLAVAMQLNRMGHKVTVFEKQELPGGLLRYGIPNFKLEKWVVDRRIHLLEEEGILFSCGAAPSPETLEHFDATVLCIGAGVPRDLPIPGRELDGIHFALEFLQRQNRLLLKGRGGEPDVWGKIDAKGKHVIVIGGGDTGSDCIGTALRQGAKSVSSFEMMPMPPEQRSEKTPWPYWPMQLRTSTSHKEGGDRFWSIKTKEFRGFDGQVRHLVTQNADGTGFEREWPAELVLIACGFLGPEQDGLIAKFGLETDARSNIKTVGYMSSRKGVFAAGDTRTGQSLVVRAIADGRACADAVNRYLSTLPRD